MTDVVKLTRDDVTARGSSPYSAKIIVVPADFDRKKYDSEIWNHFIRNLEVR